MPIGKNAIKRVSANTSTQEIGNKVVEEKIEAVEEKTTKPKATPKATPKTAEAKKTTTKATAKKQAENKAEKKPTDKKATSTPKKSMETEPTFSPVKTAEKIIEKKENAQRQGSCYINIGGELPYYLL